MEFCNSWFSIFPFNLKEIDGINKIMDTNKHDNTIKVIRKIQTLFIYKSFLIDNTLIDYSKKTASRP